MIADRRAYGSPRSAGTAVTVRAVGDEPMAFIAVAAGVAVVEVVDEDRKKRASIGVPRRRVFARNEPLFLKLRAAHRGGQYATLRALWAAASAADLDSLPAMARATKPLSHPS